METLYDLPNLYQESSYEDEPKFFPSLPYPSISRPPFIDAVAKNKKIAEILTNNIVKTKYLFPITEIKLPLIDNSNINLFPKIVSDERSQIDTFRNYLREKFLDIENKHGSESYYSDLEKIGLDIKKNVEGIGNDLKILSRKRAFQLSGSTVASIVAILVAADKEVFDFIGKVIGTSEGLYLFFEALIGYSLGKKLIEKNPTYFFWLLSREINPIC